MYPQISVFWQEQVSSFHINCQLVEQRVSKDVSSLSQAALTQRFSQLSLRRKILVEIPLTPCVKKNLFCPLAGAAASQTGLDCDRHNQSQLNKWPAGPYAVQGSASFSRMGRLSAIVRAVPGRLFASSWGTGCYLASVRCCRTFIKPCWTCPDLTWWVLSISGSQAIRCTDCRQ